MRLNSIKKYIAGDNAIISAQFDSPTFKQPRELFFSYPGRYIDYLPESADPFFPALLIPSMLAGEELEVIPPLSSRMLKAQATIQSVFAAWFPSEYSRVKVVTRSRKQPEEETYKPNATFFSLGVDSMFTMLKYLPDNCPYPDQKLSALIYMKGLELPLSAYSNGQDKEVIDTMTNVAEHFNLDLIVGETNIRDVFPLVWEKYYSGPGLASTALSLSNGFGNVYIPSSNSYADLIPNPSSPLIDSLWSNENTNIIHDGAEIERARKISSRIVKEPFALRNLRVCISNQGGNYNCGKCWKCVRTMITLKIIKRLKGAGSFPEKLPDNYFKQLRTFNYQSLKFTTENLRLAREYGDSDMEKILKREIRIGKLDVFREGKPIDFLLKEGIYYFLIKAGRKTRLIPWF